MAQPVASKSRTLIALVVLVALGFFGLGLLVANVLADRDGNEHDRRATSPSTPLSAVSSAPDLPSDASLRDGGGPTIFFDPSSIQLLPDAALHIEIPEGFDAGLAP
jgi:hypothetical protein